jgi:putative flippase GtrA
VTRLLRESMFYSAASGCALGVDMAILWILVHFFSWGYLAAATLSFLAGGVVAYEISVKLAFRYHALADRRLEFLTFIAIGAAGLIINEAVIFLAVNEFALHYMVAKCVAAGFTFTCNFTIRRQILFVARSPV